MAEPMSDTLHPNNAGYWDAAQALLVGLALS